MTFKTFTTNAQAERATLILTTPESLREAANRLEHAAEAVNEGESVLCELAPGVMGIYKPEKIIIGMGYTSKPMWDEQIENKSVLEVTQ